MLGHLLTGTDPWAGVHFLVQNILAEDDLPDIKKIPRFRQLPYFISDIFMERPILHIRLMFSECFFSRGLFSCMVSMMVPIISEPTALRLEALPLVHGLFGVLHGSFRRVAGFSLTA